MIEYVNLDIFKSKADAIVNPVNTVGVMGAGLAKLFAERYPKMEEEYVQLCEEGKLRVGMLHWYESDDYWLVNFPTKAHYQNLSKLAYIEAGLKTFVATYESYPIQSISFPQLGSGLGGLVWEDVRQLMERYLQNLPLHIYIHVPPFHDA